MTSLFYFSYTGSKRSEMKHIMPFIKDLKYDKVIEPFAGSCAFSLHLYIKENKKVKYILNDNDHTHIEFLKYVQKNTSKPLVEFLINETKNNSKENFKMHIEEYKTNPNIFNYYYYHKHYNFRQGLYPMPELKRRQNYEGLSYPKTDEFFKNATIIEGDYKNILEKYKNDTKALIFLDPPYFSSSNSDYASFKKDKKKKAFEKGVIKDMTGYYVQCIEYLKTCKCKVLMILNSNELMDYIFKDYIKKKYKKQYSMTKKDAEHILITNF